MVATRSATPPPYQYPYGVYITASPDDREPWLPVKVGHTQIAEVTRELRRPDAEPPAAVDPERAAASEQLEQLGADQLAAPAAQGPHVGLGLPLAHRRHDAREV